MNGEMQTRIKHLLSPAIARVQCIALVCWLAVLTVTPDVECGVREVLLTAAMMVTCVWQYRAADFRVWRGAGMASVVTVALCFSQVTRLNNDLGINWSLLIAIMIILCSTLLVVYTRDYLLVSILSWVILSPAQGVDKDSVTYVFMILFFISSISLGVLLNHTYTRTLRKVLSLESRFRELSLTDDLTDILNRRALMQALDEHVAHNSAGYFLMLDIDNFKHINDRFGHDAGDDVLRLMATCLQKTRGSLAFGRMGGEEFGVILPASSEEAASDYVMRLLDTIRATQAVSKLTCSAGLANIDAGSSSLQVLKAADVNLYQAKRGGKDQAFWKGAPIAEGAVQGSANGCEKVRPLTP
ncbi:GGDEF domain protein [Pseudomonas coronafaciens pv. atropurpurea]|uniref:GGDEF domain-containing protein n=1 Tax=Pseudomonas coronafaciens TaxID=53409 RepID=UPI0006D5ED72|nr:GGDEF domain-containing protein [Pseudomonas coronafaciens]KPW34328.1 GGDEF domain protein [Pseudomonas coronafaciens pv. atropurpurea]RMT64166.1 GGDEF domain protein [Pseudomonas coronafaciens pv. atropurpurea]